MTKEYKSHYSVFFRECIEFLINEKFTFQEDEKKYFYFFDGTFGGGGHSLGLLKSNPKVFLVATDQDPEAFENGEKKLEEYKMRSKLYNCNFEGFAEKFLNEFNDEKLSGAIMDLGVSSHHFDSPERGFSLRFDGPLDMRMAANDNTVLTAKEIINEFSEEEIADILFEFGEERLSRRIAKAIIDERSKKTIQTTKELENIVFHCYPKKSRFGKTHPATRTFQALRLAVNRELEVLRSSIPKTVELLDSGARFCIISFHSLEDRIVKQEFRKLKDEKKVKLLTKKPILPSEEELQENSRSRSAKLRVCEKL